MEKESTLTLEETIALFHLTKEVNSVLDTGLPKVGDVSEEEYLIAEQHQIKNQYMKEGINKALMEVLSDG